MIKQSRFQPVTLTVPECVSDEDDHSDGMTPFSNTNNIHRDLDCGSIRATLELAELLQLRAIVFFALSSV
jgi:hypothetical protein